MPSLIDEQIDAFARANRQSRIHRDYEENINADRIQVIQALMNLWVNASQAMPAGGDLHIKTRNVEIDRETAKVEERKEITEKEEKEPYLTKGKGTILIIDDG